MLSFVLVICHHNPLDYCFNVFDSFDIVGHCQGTLERVRETDNYYNAAPAFVIIKAMDLNQGYNDYYNYNYNYTNVHRTPTTSGYL